MTKGWRSLIRKVWRTSVLGRRVTSWCEERNWQKQLVVIHTATQQSDVLLTNQEPARQHLDIQPPRNQSGTFIRPLVNTVKRWTSCLPASHLNRPISWRDQPQTDTAVMDTKGRNLQPPACEQPQTNQQSVSINIKNTHTHSPPASGFPPRRHWPTNNQLQTMHQFVRQPTGSHWVIL